MEAKEFQRQVLERVERYLEILGEERKSWEKRRKLAIEDPDAGIEPGDFAAKAWQRMLSESPGGMSEPYSPRMTATGLPVPNFTLKVPTGGGKTYLAVQTLVRLVEHFQEPGTSRFVLWVMPSEAIYRQTEAALKNQTHPYRRVLDIATGNRVKILDKESPLHKADTESHLCILLLMLPSAAREKSVEKLKVFRDRGSVNGFLPPEDDRLAHESLKAAISNLDSVDIQTVLDDGALSEKQTGLVRSSLGNALRLLRPIIIMDEGHKGYSDIAHRTLYDFNPSVVIELTATPKQSKTRHANCLVSVTGEQLHDEEMIKLPLLVRVAAESDRMAALRDAWQQTELLQEAADAFRANDGDYIRPILLVQVERTGDDKVEEDFIHAHHVKQWLIEKGIPEEAIAIKTSDQNDLKEISPQELLSERCRYRVIITKQALQEGWDCPFAYVLCSLAVNKSTAAMTQLVGRILRQPQARRTGVEALDQCYVFTNRVETKIVLDSIKKGLEEDGLADLSRHVVDATQSKPAIETRHRRPAFHERKYYLPKVLKRVDLDGYRALDWETDLLGAIDWAGFDVPLQPNEFEPGTSPETGAFTRLGMAELRGAQPAETVKLTAASQFDAILATRMLDDFIPNPWRAHAIVQKWLDQLKSEGWSPEDLGSEQRFIIEKLIQRARREVDLACEKVFRDGLESGSIAFHLVASSWWEVPNEEPVAVSVNKRKLRHKDDSDLQKSLFEPVYESEYNRFEGAVACFLDQRDLVKWWYRNAVRGSGFGLQGWRRNKIYPDFIVALECTEDEERWLVLETKGNQLAQNLDSRYKSAVFEILTTTYSSGRPMGTMTLVERRASYELAMVYEEDWEIKLGQHLRSISANTGQ